MIIINKDVLLICVFWGNLVNWMKKIGRMEIMVKNIEFINVSWYKMFVILFWVIFSGWIFGI